MPKPVAIWNSARDVWEQPQTEGLFCEHLDVFSETFPTSGMTLNGVAYGLELKPTRDTASAMLDLVTHASGSLSLLPTVVAAEGIKGSIQTSKERSDMGIQVWLSNVVQDISLLPTPKASDGEKGGPNQRGSSGDYMLPSAVVHLLPTPTVGMMMGGSQGRSGSRSNELLLPGVAKQIGENTSRPSAGGSSLLDGQLPGQLSVLDALAESA